MKPSPLTTLLAAAALPLFAQGAACAAEFRFTPSIVIGEEYNDNLFQSSTRPVTEYVTRVQPNLALNAKGGGFNADLSYGFDYRYFAKNSRADQFDHRAALVAGFGAPGDFLHLDLSDTYSRVSANVARDVTSESLVVNQTLQNSALVSPYLTWRLPGASTLTTGYRYRDVRYWSGSGVDKTEHDGYALWSRELTAGLVLKASYSYARIASELDTLTRHEAYAGLRYDWSAASFVYGNLGYDWQRIDNGRNRNDPFWDAGVSRDFGFLTATAGTRVQYTEDPQTISTRNVNHYLTLSRVFSRGTASFNASYGKYDKDGVAVRDVQHKVLLALNGRYELRPDLGLNLGVSGDRLSRTVGSDFPYHLNAGAGVDYTLGSHAVLGANYSYISYRSDLGSSRGGIDVNRVIVELRLSR
ncbi:TIGR03016 family PEP-CTERM system-associated outer membrane protein [Geomonas anaerohicana]|uniref:TIGR03016 family PEP-CTERM system-associated outer membrane protein n=1 Tax=Geomonas anaerohicana TaxID=2798583 RepID=A0ABS0YBY1_9BACT|nr:TIGR03016 family PEP-CTERM system-associated outer membrane protein [Geomonas anaerohicana]MBJ6749815.1 TIGR03016 family PEP-CTERM system-associated outer membrane protein [Geomonas anaerohicana]